MVSQQDVSFLMVMASLNTGYFPCLWCCHNEMMMMVKECEVKDNKSMMIQVKSGLS